MKALAINAWGRIFEANLVKDAASSLMIPMKRGTGFAKLALLPNGAAAYGVWVMLLQVALGCVPRGTLVFTDKQGLHAHDADSLHLVTGFSQDDIRCALIDLLDIGWLEEVEVSPVSATTSSATKETLENLLKEMGARVTYNGEPLIEEWYNAVKGLGPKKVRRIFEETTPGISMPSAFIRARKAAGL